MTPYLTNLKNWNLTTGYSFQITMPVWRIVQSFVNGNNSKHTLIKQKLNWFLYFFRTLWEYVAIHRHTVSLYHNSSVWLHPRDQNPTDFTSVGYLTLLGEYIYIYIQIYISICIYIVSKANDSSRGWPEGSLLYSY